MKAEGCSLLTIMATFLLPRAELMASSPQGHQETHRVHTHTLTHTPEDPEEASSAEGHAGKISAHNKGNNYFRPQAPTLGCALRGKATLGSICKRRVGRRGLMRPLSTPGWGGVKHWRLSLALEVTWR